MTENKLYDEFVEKVKKITDKLGLSESEISIAAGRNSGYIAQLKSRKDAPKKFLEILDLKFKDALEGKSLPTHEEPPWTMNEDPGNYGQKSTAGRLLAIIEQQSATILSQQQTIQSLIATQGNASSPQIASM